MLATVSKKRIVAVLPNLKSVWPRVVYKRYVGANVPSLP